MQSINLQVAAEVAIVSSVTYGLNIAGYVVSVDILEHSERCLSASGCIVAVSECIIHACTFDERALATTETIMLKVNHFECDLHQQLTISRVECKECLL